MVQCLEQSFVWFDTLLHAEDDELVYCDRNCNNKNITEMLQCESFWKKRFQLKFGHLGNLHFERYNIFHKYIDYYMHCLYGNRKYYSSYNVNLQKTFENLKDFYTKNKLYNIKKTDNAVYVFKRRYEYNYVRNINELRTEIEFYIFKDGKIRIKGCKSPQELEHFHDVCKVCKVCIGVNSPPLTSSEVNSYSFLKSLGGGF